jgi:catechol 2,3-dioxygenase-like lactoylglutathione lyase family enzyme
MIVAKLAHYAVRTSDIEASRHFYVDVLGLRIGFRPPFNFPGLWLYAGEDERDFGIVHLIGESCDGRAGLDDYLGARGANQVGSGALDHVAFLAANWDDLRRRLEDRGLEFVERSVPALGLHQVFITDPAGVIVELNFPRPDRQSAAPWRALE